jgi:hypothetical protein
MDKQQIRALYRNEKFKKLFREERDRHRPKTVFRGAADNGGVLRVRDSRRESERRLILCGPELYQADLRSVTSGSHVCRQI